MPSNRREHWEAEFARLAMRNFVAVESAEGQYDATQGLLSLLALVVVSNERGLFAKIADVSRRQMVKDDWPVESWQWHCKWNAQDGDDGRRNDGLFAFLRMLRHSLAHAQFEFWGDEETLNGIGVDYKYGENMIKGHWVGFQVRIAVEKLAELLESPGDGDK